MSDSDVVENTAKMNAGTLGNTARRALWYNFSAFVKIILVPTIFMTTAMIALNQLLEAYLRPDDGWWWGPGFTFLGSAIGFVFYALVGVTTLRFVLLNEFPPAPFWVSFRKQNIKFVLEAALIFFVLNLPFTMIFFALAAFLPSEAELANGTLDTTLTLYGWPIKIVNEYAQLVLLGVIASQLLSLWIALRLLPFYPVSAVDNSGSILFRLRQAWKLSKGSAFRLLIAFFIAVFPLALVVIAFMAVLIIINMMLPLLGGVNVGLVLMLMGSNATYLLIVVVFSVVVAFFYESVVS